MRITYVTYDTDLWGGVCVIFQHLELLSEAGHDVFLTTSSPKPDWYSLKVPLNQIKSLDPSFIPNADIIVATSWPTIKPVVESRKGIPVHLCQGYEAANKEIHHMKDMIDNVYSYNIPKLTTSSHLDRFLRERFNAETYPIGMMLEREIFYPSDALGRKNSPDHFTILVVGPFEADVKNILTALKGITHAKKMLKEPIRLIRVSQFHLTVEEREFMKPDAYHFRVPYHLMGEIYRGADLLISMSKEAEGFGLPALEAMGCGVPTILSNISSYASFDENLDYALFVEPLDVGALADAIVKLYQSRPLREKLIERGLSVAEKHTKDKVANRLNSVLEEIRYKDKLSKVKKAWNEYHASSIPGMKKHWWDSPVIMEHCQELVTGDPRMNFHQFLKKEFVRDPLEKGLSICGGSGEFERELLDNNICKAIDIYEIAEDRVKEGIERAKEKNYAINFYTEDVNQALFKQNCYDVFFSWAALHHIENLEGVCEHVRDALKDGGLVVVQEFIGPNQFQWTEKQLEITNRILSLLPERLKKKPETGELLQRVERPSIEQMNINDPSEAIRSRDIIPVLKRFFTIKTVRYFGGSIYNLLFHDIIGNFDHDDEKDTALIRMILRIEQILIEESILDNDYAVIIAEKN